MLFKKYCKKYKQFSEKFLYIDYFILRNTYSQQLWLPHYNIPALSNMDSAKQAQKWKKKKKKKKTFLWK